MTAKQWVLINYPNAILVHGENGSYYVSICSVSVGYSYYGPSGRSRDEAYERAQQELISEAGSAITV